MSRSQAWFVHLSNALVGGTGLAYGWMRYFAVSDDPYSVVNHPWQPDLRQAHIVLAPLTVFAVGWVWNNHISLHWRAGTRRGRRSGSVLVGLFFPMVFSGYLLQTAVDETWRLIWAWLHGSSSALWVLLGCVHPFLRGARSVIMSNPG